MQKNLSNKKIIQFRFIFICIGLCFLFACVPIASKSNLQPPTRHKTKSKNINKASFSFPVQKETKKIIENTKVNIEANVSKTEKEVKQVLAECIEFLIKTFGLPIYKGKIDLVVTSKPLFRGRTSWRTTNTALKKVKINDFALYKKEKRILVHELFHVLYQSNQLVQNSPEFILEGLATYAEFKYIYPNKKDKYIYDDLYQREISFKCKSEFINYNDPVESYGGCRINKIYLQGAMFFFAQKESSISKVNRILKNPPGEKLYFKQWAKYYSLEFAGIFKKYKTQNEIKNTKIQSSKDAIFYIQVSAVRSKINAKKAADCIYRNDFPAEVKADKHLFVVLVGGFLQKKDADEAKKEVKKLQKKCGFDKKIFVIP